MRNRIADQRKTSFGTMQYNSKYLLLTITDPTLSGKSTAATGARDPFSTRTGRIAFGATPPSAQIWCGDLDSTTEKEVVAAVELGVVRGCRAGRWISAGCAQGSRLGFGGCWGICRRRP
jgi:hypothetical protein